MSSPSAKDRVYAAAEKISAERPPTVSRVREGAAVSNADATRYLKEWRDEQATSGSQIAATPQEITEQATRLAGTVWAQAAALAEATHEALEAKWGQEKKDKDLELAELVADLDRITAEKDQTISELTSRLAAADAEVETAVNAAAVATSAETLAREETVGLKIRLATAEAKETTLQQAHNDLLRRITPHDSDSNH
ncbi:DNA-binding protein [Paeniglutamicibacter antarcticus]|uniref:DNA-binding protein n=1 Tax=Arthrobacter terrae TaxID=2935737 RepID=A0A931CNX9_9MICC|nr:DNA-binding protein [Arthrobacter terrae]MBG0738844.1 DNA-binding protein [Arthrobacter terrae]